MGWVRNRPPKLKPPPWPWAAPLATAGEEEGVERLGGPQVLGRDASHLPADLDQGGGQLRGSPDQERPRTVGRQLPVPGERHGEQEADEVHHDGDQHHDHLDQDQLAPLLLLPPPPPPPNISE